MPDPNLPPAGHKRREVLAQRADALAEVAEVESNKIDGGTGDLKNVRPDREILEDYDMLHVTNAQPEFWYCWVHTGQHGIMIKKKTVEGYEVVQGDMPEATELKGVGGDTTRRLGDCLLMRIQLDRKVIQERSQNARKRALEEGIDSRLRDMSDEAERKHGISVKPMGGLTNTEYQKQRSQRR